MVEALGAEVMVDITSQGVKLLVVINRMDGMGEVCEECYFNILCLHTSLSNEEIAFVDHCEKIDLLY